MLPEQDHSPGGEEVLALGGAVEFYSFKASSHFLVLPSTSHVHGVFIASKSLFPDLLLE